MAVQSIEPPIPELRFVKGIGPKRAAVLEKIGISTIKDLIYHFPRRYEDRSQFTHISDLKIGEPTTISVQILKVQLIRLRALPMVEVKVGDESGTITAIWFNQSYLAKKMKVGDHLVLYGKPELYKKRLQFNNPEFEYVDENESSVHVGRITPIYPASEGLNQKAFRNFMNHAVHSYMNTSVNDTLPEKIRNRYQLIPLLEALRKIHFPETYQEIEEAKSRLVFDEFLSFQLACLKEARENLHSISGISFKTTKSLLEKFKKALPFTLTNSQEDVLKEISSQLQLGKHPMNRLLQGDVGSGKTVIAAWVCLMSWEAGYQSAFLVPTEILSEQHYKSVTQLLKPFKIKIGLLTKSTSKNQKEKIIAEVKAGKLDLIIGTHSILQEYMQFQKLGLVIIDEQHKFGVEQRNKLLSLTPKPHALIMTATPIPRTLALTIYADSDISTIRELPKGRKPIKTYWIDEKDRHRVVRHIKEKVDEGRQAYIVFPIIDETEKMDIKAAEKEFENLKKKIFKGYSLGLVHGRIKKEERDAVMKNFYLGEIQILVATSVIEVGIDQPNATIMVIENSERFGLAGLHQLRGRVGRGEEESECFLFGQPNTDEGKKRLRILCTCQDGFKIADEDLKLRGPGDLWGLRQSGIPHFKLAHPIWHESILKETKKLAHETVDSLEQETWVKNYLDHHLVGEV